MSKALKEAIEANDAAAVKKALKTVKDLSKKLPQAEPPLVYAIAREAEAVIEALLDAGAMEASGGGTGGHEREHPFAVAAEKGHVGIMEKLAARGVPENVVEHVLMHVVMNGKTEAAKVVLERCKPAAGGGTERVVELSTWWSDGKILELLLAHGADVNAQNDGEANHEMKGETALHEAARHGYVEPVRLLVEHGADVNARDMFGRTPLMEVAAGLPFLDRQRRNMEEMQAERAAQGKPPFTVPKSAGRFGDREDLRPMEAAKLLLERGADARAKDRFGNNALDYYCWERFRDREEYENGEFVGLLKKHGATGSAGMDALWLALRASNAGAARAALKAGADPNRDAPPPVSATPLMMCKSAAMVKLLLEHGADVHKAGLKNTPLIAAARSGELEIVKALVKAGADIHAIGPRAPRSEHVVNAWSAAQMNRKQKVMDYLKSLGAKNPVLADWEPLEAGVVVWENFSEIIVKAGAAAVAGALGRLIGGKVVEGVYGKEMAAGKMSYAVLQPRGMAWSNVMRVMPPVRRFEADEKFLRGLAKESGAAVMLIEYSDTAGASSMKRFEPGGEVEQEHSGDEEGLEEMVGAMGKAAPEWAKKQLKKLKKEKRPELDLKKLAEAEKFVIAWGNLPLAGKKSVEVSFTNLPAEAFEGVVWVSV